MHIHSLEEKKLRSIKFYLYHTSNESMNEMICKIKIIHGLKNVTSTQLTVHIKTEEHILYQERPLDTKLCIHTKLKNILYKDQTPSKNACMHTN